MSFQCIKGVSLRSKDKATLPESACFSMTYTVTRFPGRKSASWGSTEGPSGGAARRPLVSAPMSTKTPYQEEWMTIPSYEVCPSHRMASHRSLGRGARVNLSEILPVSLDLVYAYTGTFWPILRLSNTSASSRSRAGIMPMWEQPMSANAPNLVLLTMTASMRVWPSATMSFQGTRALDSGLRLTATFPVCWEYCVTYTVTCSPGCSAITCASASSAASAPIAPLLMPRSRSGSTAEASQPRSKKAPMRGFTEVTTPV
mmetsp:Transcript_57682/g.146314  ORF Transcript_57682/g.146314 Transcript_57682/m.146314 type:complete len:258 (-) Transcript_57682:519-1292(-)